MVYLSEIQIVFPNLTLQSHPLNPIYCQRCNSFKFIERLHVFTTKQCTGGSIEGLMQANIWLFLALTALQNNTFSCI
jgi:hypothetical protein